MLTYKQFGEILILTGDLDPVYVMLARARLDREVLARFCLAYWLFYHVGVAARIAQRPSKKFFSTCRREYRTCPRGTERRHFRGKKGLEAINQLEEMSHGKPEWIVWFIYGDHTNAKARKVIGQAMPFSTVRDRVLSLPQFGPWMAFKVADMGERVLGYKIDFSDCDLEMYRDPVKGAALVRYGDPNKKIGPKGIRQALARCKKRFGGMPAPPVVDGVWARMCSLQEFETVLCKYKSHFNGHYKPGKDWKEIRAALKDSGSTLGTRLRRTLSTFKAQVARHVPPQLQKALKEDK